MLYGEVLVKLGLELITLKERDVLVVCPGEVETVLLYTLLHAVVYPAEES